MKKPHASIPEKNPYSQTTEGEEDRENISTDQRSLIASQKKQILELTSKLPIKRLQDQLNFELKAAISARLNNTVNLKVEDALTSEDLNQSLNLKGDDAETDNSKNSPTSNTRKSGELRKSTKDLGLKIINGSLQLTSPQKPLKKATGFPAGRLLFRNLFTNNALEKPTLISKNKVASTKIIEAISKEIIRLIASGSDLKLSELFASAYKKTTSAKKYAEPQDYLEQLKSGSQSDLALMIERVSNSPAESQSNFFRAFVQVMDAVRPSGMNPKIAENFKEIQVSDLQDLFNFLKDNEKTFVEKVLAEDSKTSPSKNPSPKTTKNLSSSQTHNSKTRPGIGR